MFFKEIDIKNSSSTLASQIAHDVLKAFILRLNVLRLYLDVFRTYESVRLNDIQKLRLNVVRLMKF